MRPAHRLHRLGWLGGLLAVCASTAAAAGPGLEVHLQPRRFGVEDAAQLTIRITEPPAGLQAPSLGELENLEIVAGPSTGSEFSLVNGVVSRSQTFTYVLRGLAPGSASVGPVTARAGDVELRAGAVSVEVVEGSIAPPRGRGRRSSLFSDPFADLVPRRAPPPVELVLRHSFSDREVGVGEPLIATIYLDSTVASIDRFDLKTAPSYPGFWAQRVDYPEQPTREVVEVDGTKFYRYPVLRHVLIPLKAGRIEIPSVTSVVSASRSVFDRGQLVERASPVRTIDVVERPAAPPGFSGAVGAMSYRAGIEPAEIEFGESAVVTVWLKGRGNLPLVEAPALWPSCADCDTYPPEETSHVTINESGISGTRTWQMTVVPQRWGDVEFEPVQLAVFNPTKGSYESQTIGPLKLVVAAPPPTPTPVVTPVPIQERDVGGTLDDDPRTSATAPSWRWIVGTLTLGLLLGGSATWALTRRRRPSLPPRRSDQSPAERARELQLTLERWWLDARSSARGAALEEEMQDLRRELEAVRFAPGRADHSDTVVDLEGRLKKLMRRV